MFNFCLRDLGLASLDLTICLGNLASPSVSPGRQPHPVLKRVTVPTPHPMPNQEMEVLWPQSCCICPVLLVPFKLPRMNLPEAKSLHYLPLTSPLDTRLHLPAQTCVVYSCRGPTPAIAGPVCLPLFLCPMSGQLQEL